MKNNHTGLIFDLNFPVTCSLVVLPLIINIKWKVVKPPIGIVNNIISTTKTIETIDDISPRFEWFFNI